MWDAAVGYESWKKSRGKSSKGQNCRSLVRIFFCPKHQQVMIFQRYKTRLQSLQLPNTQYSLWVNRSVNNVDNWIKHNLYQVLLPSGTIGLMSKTLTKKVIQPAYVIDSDLYIASVRIVWNNIYCTSPVDAPFFLISISSVNEKLFLPLTRYFMGRWTNKSETTQRGFLHLSTKNERE